MWHRREVLGSGARWLVLGMLSGGASAAELLRQPGRVALDEAAETLGAVAAYGGALDALLNGRADLYARARDELGASHDALMSITDAPGQWPWQEEANGGRLVLRRLAAAARLQAERLDRVVRNDVRAAGECARPSCSGSAPGVLVAAREWRKTCGSPDAGVEMILAGPLACALEVAHFSSRRHTRGRQSILDVYASYFEAVLQGTNEVSGPAFVAATRARAAAAEALGHVRSARSVVRAEAPCRKALV